MKRELMKNFMLAILMVMILAESVAADEDFLKHYKSGLTALESEDWSRAAKLMRMAIQERDEEARRLPKYLYLKPYLPHFYLGLANFKGGNCTNALKAWKTSERQGIIQKRPQYQQIEMAREICRSRQESSTPVTPPQQHTAPSRQTPQSSSSPTRQLPPPPTPRPAPKTTPPPAVRKDAEIFNFGNDDRQSSGEFPLGSEDRFVRPRLQASGEPPPASLIDAATSLLNGSYQQVIDQLSKEIPADVYTGAHFELLLAGAEFALYLTSGESDTNRLDNARRWVLKVRKTLPELEPSEKFFSPRFLDFYYGQRPEEER